MKTIVIICVVVIILAVALFPLAKEIYLSAKMRYMNASDTTNHKAGFGFWILVIIALAVVIAFGVWHGRTHAFYGLWR